MNIKQEIKTQEEARQYAIDWQIWVSEQNPIGANADDCKLYTSDVAKWGEVFTELAERFDLEEEFRENGII
jgi:hypothetical protein